MALEPAVLFAACMVAAVLCMVIAEGKKRSVLAWGVLGLMFPLIGLVAAALVAPLGPRERACPRCRRVG